MNSADTTFNISSRVYSVDMSKNELLYAVLKFGLWYNGATKTYTVKVVFEE